MTLINKLDQEIWVKGNYTATSGNGLSGTIYTEPKMANAKNLTGYTLKIRLYDQNRREVFSDDCDILVAGSGTWEFLPVKGEFNIDFIGEVEIELTKSDETEELTAYGVNGSSKLRIR